MFRSKIFGHSTSPKIACAAAIALTLGACASVPTPLQGQFPPTTPHDAMAGTIAGPVRWGGEILNVEPHADQTCFEILARELDSIARPVGRDPSAGRFIACRNGFYDPEEFKKGRDITIVGQLNGTEKGKVGDFDYTYPRVAAEMIYLWPERPLYVNTPYYDPWGPWWGYGPYWGGPYWGPYWGGTIVVRHPHPSPPPPPKGS
jgi:outer membrane lipoprotein